MTRILRVIQQTQEKDFENECQEGITAQKLITQFWGCYNCPSAEGSEDMSVTNSEVESAMNHQRCRAVLRDPKFSGEAFNAFSSADAYIRAARDGLRKATKQHLTDVQVSFFFVRKG